MNVLYKFVQSTLENSSPIVFNKIICKTMKIDFKNSLKIGNLIFWD